MIKYYMNYELTEGVDMMLIKLEQEIAKLNSLKVTLDEMRASL